MAAIALGTTPLANAVFTGVGLASDYVVQYRPVAPPTYADNFNRADAGTPPNGLGPNWYKRSVSGAYNIVANKATPTYTRDDSVFGYVGDMPSSDMYVEALVRSQGLAGGDASNPQNGSWSAINLRHQLPYRNEIELVLEPHLVFAIKEHVSWLQGAEYTIANVGGVVPDQVYRLRLEVEGNVATGFVDNVQKLRGPTVSSTGRGVGIGSFTFTGTCDQDDWKAGPLPPWQTWNEGVTTVPGTVVSGLTQGTQYQFRVAPVSSVDGQGAWSDTVMVVAL
jgi:hypothetical protein